MCGVKSSRTFEEPIVKGKSIEQQEAIKSLAEQLDRERKEKIDLGEGQAARVWFTESPRFRGQLCIKEVYNREATLNDIEKEMELQQEAWQAGVNVAQPIFYIKTDQTEFIVMGIIPGKSIEQMVKDKEFISQEEVEIFQASLKEQLSILHDKAQVHHRDLHDGNVMVRPDFTAALVDFGHAKWAGAVDEEEVYQERVVRNGRFVTEKLKQDDNMVTSLCQKLVAKKEVA